MDHLQELNQDKNNPKDTEEKEEPHNIRHTKTSVAKETQRKQRCGGA
ncbi:hypothetical protein RA11412_0729 [Rothia aeria]|uniref:Uncharacterized protein n=1 Tax=Rothia aeria TaxID=172042 RepID=A0A2Z5QX72_9MICC|nr:hypothetical protein RA11412_0729 [Rothia aeria]